MIEELLARSFIEGTLELAAGALVLRIVGRFRRRH
jgi:hypothetical protein